MLKMPECHALDNGISKQESFILKKDAQTQFSNETLIKNKFAQFEMIKNRSSVLAY